MQNRAIIEAYETIKKKQKQFLQNQEKKNFQL